MNSFEVFVLLELFINRMLKKYEIMDLVTFRSIVIGHISRSSSYESFISNLTVSILSIDIEYCKLLSAFKRYVRKVQKIYEGTYNNF